MQKLFATLRSAGISVLIMSFASLALPAQAAGTQYLTLDSFSGHPGATINITGGGFTGSETINIYLNDRSGAPATTSKTDANGSFTAALTIPPTTAQGNVTIIGIGADSGLSATNIFFVQNFNPSFSISSKANTPGSSATITGSDFAPNEVVNIAFGSKTLTATADATGAFSSSITIPIVAANTYTITATGQTSNASANAYFYVGGFYPNISPSAYYVLPEQSVSFSGSGFAPGETVNVTLGDSAIVITSFNADTTGSFKNAGSWSASFSLAGQSVTFHLKGATSNTDVTTAVHVGQLNSILNVSDYFIMPSFNDSFWGSGYAANEPIILYQGGDSSQVLGTSTSDKNGNFTNLSVNIPYSYSGMSKTFTAQGGRSGSKASVTVNVGQLYPQITPSTYYAKPGQQITISGYGFAPNESVNVAVNGKAVLQATADAKTDISTDPITIPFGSKTVNITATGVTSGAQAVLPLQVAQYNPWVNASSYYVMPGSDLSFTGQDFAPNEDVTVSYNGNTIETIHTDANGALGTNSISFPFSLHGKVALNFTGVTSGATSATTVESANFYPWLVSDNYFAVPGTSVNVSGNGFAKGEMVKVSAENFSAEISADSKTGNTAAVAVNIPFSAKDNYTITFTGEQSAAAASIKIGIAAFTPYATASNYYVGSGQSTTFSGAGFAPNEMIDLSFNGLKSETIAADAKGAFTSPLFILPQGTIAAHFDFTGESSGATTSVDLTVAH